MPAMDGIELIRSIRKLEESMGMKRMPVVACTSWPATSDVVRALQEAGADHCFPKV